MSYSTKFRESSVDDAFGNWMAGFVDGEGNFHNHMSGFAFRLWLREDDRAILEEMRQRLGVGKMTFRKVQGKNWKNTPVNTRDQWGYLVQPVVDLIHTVIPIFEKYPLRAKKRLQYEAWKQKLQQTPAYRILTLQDSHYR